MSGGGRPAATSELVAALTDAVLVVEAGVVVEASPGAADRIGAGGLVGRPVVDLVHPGETLPGAGAPTATVRLESSGSGYRWFEATRIDHADDGYRLALRDVHDRVTGEQALRTSQRRLRDALDRSLDGFAIYEARRGDDGRVEGLRLLLMNAAGAVGFGHDPADLVGRDLRDILPECLENGLWVSMVQALETGEPMRARLERIEGGRRLVDDGVAVRLDADTVVTTWRDVSEAVRQQDLLARAYDDTAQVRAVLETALAATSDSFAVYGLERDEAGEVRRIVVRLANPAAAMPMGYAPDEIVGRDLLEAFPDLQSCGLWEVIVASVEERCPRRHRVHIQDESGAWSASFDNTVAPVGEDQVVVTWRDVTTDEQGRRDLERTRSQAEHAAAHDHLTGLPNRSQLERRLRESLAEAAPGHLVAVVFCDLDGFKAVNDTYGHPAGDTLLREVAQRLLQLTRADDTAARLSGDEFVLVLRDLPAGWRPHDFVQRADDVLRRPVQLAGAVVTPSASMGVVLIDPSIDGRRPEELLAQADGAMYEAKRARGLRQPEPDVRYAG